MNRYVALLRGINVGGNNLIKMVALKACFEKQKLQEVVTYIQSGNVVFGAKDSVVGPLCTRIERALSEAFGYDASVVLRTHKQMKDVVGRAPKGFGTQPDKYRYDVIFLKEPLTAPVAIKTVPTAPGVDEAHAGGGVLYFSRLISEASRSRLSKIVSSPIYKSVTIRNWNTTTKLLQMMETA
ncbi:MAG TPA: DUF1697 domain-containing protein [Polyangia bacterium]|jgi:uncharacterized protein (DUF1697 family)|nr:DUF1697 domain-containing protein [Polyangia bacterium]